MGAHNLSYPILSLTIAGILTSAAEFLTSDFKLTFTQLQG